MTSGKMFRALLVASIAVSAAMSPAAARPKGGSLCFEKGCKGDRCIFCTR